MSQENVEIVRAAWQSWRRGDLVSLFELWDADVVWETTHFRSWPESAYEGHDGVRRFLTECLDVWEDYEVVRRDSACGRWASRGPGLAAGKGKAKWARDGDAVGPDNTVCDGKVTRIDNYDDRAVALEAAGLSP